MSESEDYSSNDESITDYSSDESFNDEELDGVHDRLLSAIDRFSGNQNGSHVSTNQNAVEDAFSSALTTGTVSMSDLLGALDNTKGLSAVKKKLSDFEKGLAAPAFVEKVAAQRVERSVVYGESAKDMGKWQDVVAANRNVRTLDLAQDKRQLASYRSLITKFSAENDMEREIQMVLVETGATDAEALRREEDELGSRHISVEDMRKKQIELAKVKARMFYEQMKGRRLNKIKSKAYHRIKKRQRQRRENDEMEKIAEADPEAAEQILEAKAATRIKERMTLRHRNTTKWARMALEHGKGDASLKSAYHEAVQLGHELLDKVNEVEHKSGSDGGSGDDWSDDSQSSDGEGDHGDDRKTSKKKKSSVAVKAARQLSKVLADPVEGGNLTAAGQSGRYQRLFDMDFMRKANEMQQSRAREEAQNVLLELQGLEEEDVSTDDEGDIGDSVGTATSVPKKRDAEEKQKLAVARAEMDRLFAGSQGMTATTNRGAKVKRSAGIALDTSQEQALPPQSITTTATKAVAFATTKANTEPELVSEAADVNDAQTNPWLQPVRAEGKGKGKKQEQQKLKPSLKAQQQISDVNQQKQLPAAATASSSGVNIDTTKKIDQSLKQNDNKGGHKKQIPKSSQNQSEGIGGTTAPAPVTVSISTDNVNEADKAKKQPAERKPLLMQKSQVRYSDVKCGHFYFTFVMISFNAVRSLPKPG